MLAPSRHLDSVPEIGAVVVRWVKVEGEGTLGVKVMGEMEFVLRGGAKSLSASALVTCVISQVTLKSVK